MTDETVDAPRQRSWLRRNIVALLVSVVSLGLIVFLLLGPQLIARAEADRWVVVPQGETVEASGYSFTVPLSAEFVGLGSGDDGNSIPLGDSLVGVVLQVEPVSAEVGDDAPPCDVALTSRSDGSDRTWDQVSEVSDFAYAIAEDRTAFCLPEGEAFGLEAVFLTPKGVYDEATLDLTIGDELFRFELVH